MKSDDREASGAKAGHGSPNADSIKNLVLQEAAAAIIAAGRELSEYERLNVREFLKGPALKVSLALSVMGVTMWISHMNQQAKERRQHGPGTAHRRGRRVDSTSRSQKPVP
ncbi:MAG: hypothetical protein H0W83_17530 [Planctomycetes bacterium]|nr:hypothetical protein [Planctomycetota bacterium]